jgi:hypothetical protein
MPQIGLRPFMAGQWSKPAAAVKRLGIGRGSRARIPSSLSSVSLPKIRVIPGILGKILGA